jgi:hypothetical protein
MKAARTFAVVPGGAEYHATRDGARGAVEGAPLNGLCGARVGSVTCSAVGREEAGPASRLYDEPPPGFGLCRVCGRLMLKRTGWTRLLSHLFHNRRGLRAGLRSLGRRV